MHRNVLATLAVLLICVSAVIASSSVKVALYPGSSSYVLRTYTISASGPFALEPNEIKGVSPFELSAFGDGADLYFISKYSLNKTREERKSITELINESIGKQVTLRTTSGAMYNATLLWHDDGHIGISGGKGIRIISLESIAELSLPSAGLVKKVNYSESVLSVFGTANKPGSAVTFGYAKRDLSWDIDYDLLVSNGRGKLVQYATITNGGDEEYADAAITLSMLDVNFVGSAQPYFYGYYASKSSALYEAAPGGAPAASRPEFISTSKGGVWSYTPATKVTIGPRSSHKMVVFKDDATYTKKQVWDIRRGNTVYRVYELNNSRKEVLPSGRVHVFDEDVFVGEDTISMLGSKSSKELYVSNVPHVEVERTVLSDSITGNSITSFTHTVKVRLTIKNRGNAVERIEVREDLSGYSDLKYISYSVQPFKVDGGKAYWNIPVGAGGEQAIEYVYSYSSTY
ncbi:MAG: DUF4139 domain-containing protein [Candidatus Micrarchaeota archaeon]|nr:DUF4139 domain-containing protein [Candidatus Micrarchaeota archaeon]